MQAKQDRCLGQLLLLCSSAWGHINMQGSIRPTHSATLLWTHCNWKLVSNVDDELGIAVVVCIYVCLQYFTFVHNHWTASISSSGALAPHEFFKLKILVYIPYINSYVCKLHAPRDSTCCVLIHAEHRCNISIIQH